MSNGPRIVFVSALAVSVCSVLIERSFLSRGSKSMTVRVASTREQKALGHVLWETYTFFKISRFKSMKAVKLCRFFKSKL